MRKLEILVKEVSVYENPFNTWLLKLIEKILTSQSKDNEQISILLSNFYGVNSLCLLYLKKLNECEKQAIRGLELDSSNMMIKIILANSLFFQGKTDQAFKLYIELKNSDIKQVNDYVNLCLQQLDALEAAGIFNGNLTKVREFLKS